MSDRNPISHRDTGQTRETKETSASGETENKWRPEREATMQGKPPLEQERLRELAKIALRGIIRNPDLISRDRDKKLENKVSEQFQASLEKYEEAEKQCEEHERKAIKFLFPKPYEELKGYLHDCTRHHKILMDIQNSHPLPENPDRSDKFYRAHRAAQSCFYEAATKAATLSKAIEAWYKENEATLIEIGNVRLFLRHHTHEFIKTQQGEAWFNKQGSTWLKKNGQAFLHNHTHEFVKTQQGEAWFNKEQGSAWLESNNGQVFLHHHAHEFIKTQQGEAWFNKQGSTWLKKNGQAFLHDHAHEFIKTQQGETWFNKQGSTWLKKNGQAF